MPITYDSIATQTVSGTSTSSIVFNSIPQSYTDLVLTIFGGFAADGYNQLSFNGSTSDRAAVAMTGASTSVGKGGYTIAYTNVLATGSRLTFTKIDIFNYAATNTVKPYISRAGNTEASEIIIGRWNNTAALTSLTCSVTGTTYQNNTVFALYGILKA